MKFQDSDADFSGKLEFQDSDADFCGRLTSKLQIFGTTYIWQTCTRLCFPTFL